MATLNQLSFSAALWLLANIFQSASWYCCALKYLNQDLYAVRGNGKRLFSEKPSEDL